MRRLLRLGGAEQALTNYQHAEAEVAQGELEKALKGYQEAEAPAAVAALRELEKALTNYQSAEAAAARRSVSCCGPLRVFGAQPLPASCIQIVHAREKAEDAEVAAALSRR